MPTKILYTPTTVVGIGGYAPLVSVAVEVSIECGVTTYRPGMLNGTENGPAVLIGH